LNDPNLPDELLNGPIFPWAVRKSLLFVPSPDHPPVVFGL
jgi:hypothetical protein